MLVVVPAILIQQWEHEIERLLRPRPGRGRIYTLYGNKRRVGFSELSQYDIVLTSYGVMATELGRKQRGRRWVTSNNSPSWGQTLSILGSTSHWHRVILDEAQSIQNDQPKTAIACQDIDATYRWCLTGTPLTYHLQVLYSLLKFLRVQPCPDFDVFDMVSPAFGRSRDAPSSNLRTISTPELPLSTQFYYAGDGGYSGAADPQVRSSVARLMAGNAIGMPE
jgi:SNF2 family DNA or RNA helicase